MIAFKGSDISNTYPHTDNLNKKNIFKSIYTEKINFIGKECKNNVTETKQSNVEMLLSKNGIKITDKIKYFYRITK